jgi:hypothetical protein
MERESDENFCFWLVGEQIMNETFPFLLLFMVPSVVLNWVEMRKCLDGGVPFLSILSEGIKLMENKCKKIKWIIEIIKRMVFLT